MEFIRNLDSLKAAGVWTRFQWVWDKSPGLEVAVSKERNQFRSTDSRRLTAVEKMKALHNRCKDDDEQTGREDPVEIGLYGLLQTIYIFKSSIMKDRPLSLTMFLSLKLLVRSWKGTKKSERVWTLNKQRIVH